MSDSDLTTVVLHQGTYKKTATISEAVFMITGMTIGAGILGLPYAVAQIGLIPGVGLIIGLGIIILFLHLMIGEIASHTKQALQLPGMAGRYIGAWAEKLLATTVLIGSYGTLLAYMIGESQALVSIFGGNPLVWGILFWSVGSFLLWGGLKRIKKIERACSLAVIIIIGGICLFLAFHFNVGNLTVIQSGNLFIPFGVILFALHASPAIAEAHALLGGEEKKFRRAVIIGTLIPIVVYVLFVVAVVGATGSSTSEIATINLGIRFGKPMLIIANLFAILAMSTGFMGLGTALEETLVWDDRLPEYLAKFLVVAVPFILFLWGVGSFFKILDLVGGLFIAFEAIMMSIVYWKARPQHSSWMIGVPVLVTFVIIAVVSFTRLF